MTLDPKDCDVCGVSFTPSNGRQRFCSANCRKKNASPNRTPRKEKPYVPNVAELRTSLFGMKIEERIRRRSEREERGR